MTETEPAMTGPTTMGPTATGPTATGPTGAGLAATAADDRSADRTAAVIRTEREKRGLSQAKLALRAGISPATVCQLEQGRRATTLDLADRVLGAMGLRLHVEAEPRFADIDAVIKRATDRAPAEIMAEWVPDAAAYFAFLTDVPFIVEGLAAAALQGAPVRVETLEIAVPADNEEALNWLTVTLGGIGARRGDFEIRDPRVKGSPDYRSLHGPLRIRLASPFEPVFWMDIDPMPQPRFGLMWFLREPREPLPCARIAVTPLAAIETANGHVRRVVQRTRELRANTGPVTG